MEDISYQLELEGPLRDMARGLLQGRGSSVPGRAKVDGRYKSDGAQIGMQARASQEK